MSYVIRLLAWADGVPLAESFPRYLFDFDADGDPAGGDALTVADPADARQFADVAEAWECWQQQSAKHPLRPDGQPNRPLTAFTVTVDPV